MNYEFEDYRPQKPPPPSWFDWCPQDPWKYLGWLLMLIFIIPWILGFSLSPLGILFNVVFIDYLWYRKSISIGRY
jgi:hypothetical protein